MAARFLSGALSLREERQLKHLSVSPGRRTNALLWRGAARPPKAEAAVLLREGAAAAAVREFAIAE